MADIIRVLYAEANARDADLTARYFRDTAPQFEFDVAPTGRGCLAMLPQKRYDVLLIDCHLPDMDGIDLLHAVAASGVSLPVVMVTAVGDEDLMAQGLRLGAVDHVAKAGRYVTTLPTVLQRAVTDHVATPDERAGLRRQRRVLYVEQDDAEIELTRAALARTARHLGLEVVRSSREALECLRTDRFDLVLANLRLRDMNALDLLREARRRSVHAPFMAIAGEGDEDAAMAAVTLGGFDFIVRREDRLIQLPSAIDNAIDRWQLAETNRRLQNELNERVRAQAENARMKREISGHRQRLDEIVASVPGLVWEAWGRPDGPDQKIAFISDHVEHMLGYSVDHCVLTPGFWQRIVHPDDRARAMAEATAAFSSGNGGISQYRLIAGDNRTVWVETRTTVIKNAAGRPVGLRGVTLDITTGKEADRAKAHLEEELRQAQKIESIGRLAGGVAHDFNNLLTAINGYADLVLDDLPHDAPWRAGIVEIRRAGERAAELTSQLLAFSRRQLLQPRVLDLNALITDDIKMLRRLLGEDIELITKLDPGLGPVTADAGQMHQIVLNLAVNARDAMPRGGSLVLETQNVVFEEDASQLHATIGPGAYAMLAVTDNGCGMDANTVSHIFEPFFTTKEPSKGTGLGLSTVYGIVRQSGGSIFVYSEPGSGATFKIYLPRVERAVTQSHDHAVELETLRGSETVLVVEDEEAVRNLVDQALRKYGYQVLGAANGAEALAICDAHSPIALMITDVVMPGMSGRTLAAQQRIRHPEMRVLYMSGYTDDAVVRHGLLEASMSFIQKPFTPGVLARKVRETLDQPSAV
jgi:signal transduction histidine kinase/DNA-binding NtrC family response regulator